MLIINKRTNLSFEATDLTGDRTEESYENVSCEKVFYDVANMLYEKTLDFIPKNFRPRYLKIALEYEAKVIIPKNKISELVPMSLITSRQIPVSSEIRIGMHEIQENIEAFSSILAHELGHMIIEWPTRYHRLVKDSDPVIPYWSKSIYEGVADFFAVVLTKKRVIGAKNIWFNRSIDDYPSYEIAKSAKGTLQLARYGLSLQKLDHKYKSYTHWLSLITEFLQDLGEDPYNLGTVLARELCELSVIYGEKEVVNQIINLSLTGNRYTDPQLFLIQIRNSCKSIESKKSEN